MILQLWFKFLNFVKFIFGDDPYFAQFNKNLIEIKKNYQEQISHLEATNLMLRQQLDDRQADIINLQDELIKILKPNTDPVPEADPTLYQITGGWQARQSKLEEANSRKHRAEIYTKIAERETEIEELSKPPV